MAYATLCGGFRAVLEFHRVRGAALQHQAHDRRVAEDFRQRALSLDDLAAPNTLSPPCTMARNSRAERTSHLRCHMAPNNTSRMNAFFRPRPHGVATLEVQDQIVLSREKGPWNAELVMQIHENVREARPQLTGARWGMMVIVTGSAGLWT